jgi:ribosome-interacting GTPase 1
MRTYVIINASEVANVDFDQVLETSSETLSYSLDGSKTFVKFEGDTPIFLIGEPQYTQEEILNILSGAEWAAAE